MSGKIPKSFVDEVLNRSDIVPLISSRLKLRKSGANHFGCCPFHQEKSPSFSVNETKQFYYCFGCGASGNAIGFLMSYEHLSFVEAVSQLALTAGMTLPQTDFIVSAPTGDTAFMTQILRYYQYQLRHHPQAQEAVNYLKNRGFTGEICQQFGVGFAPSGGNNLQSFFGADKTEALLAAGMLIKKENGNCFDRFRSRIMFPIRDHRARVLAFGGRVIAAEDMPKYLNSPETTLYHKGRCVFGLHEMLQHTRNREQLIVVEGYLDVMSMAQFGFHQTVASCGTALSADQAQLLFRYTDHLVFCFDGDTAGSNAAWRSLQVVLPLLEDGREASFLFLPKEQDPDSFLRGYGSESMQKLLNETIGIGDFLFQHLHEGSALNTLEGRARYAKRALEHIQTSPKGVLQQLLIQKLSKIVRMEPAYLAKILVKPQVTTSVGNVSKVAVSPLLNQMHAAVKSALSLILHHPELTAVWEIEDSEPLLSIPGMPLLLQLVSIIREEPRQNLGALLEYWREEPSTHQMLCQLASSELLIPESARAAELQEALLRINRAAHESQVNSLLSTANIRELDQEEKQLLQHLLVGGEREK